MNDLFKYREEIIQMLRTLREEYLKEYSNVYWSEETFTRVFASAEKGKLLRGALVLFAAEQYGYKIDAIALRVAVLMELAHTSLLIHDDIMDQDEMRRGEKSLYAQFSELAAENKIVDSPQVGKALGICAGDIFFFMIFQSIGRLDSPFSAKLMQVFTHELILCGFGQMQDVAPHIRSYEDILLLYRYKTGRYSFSLPMMLGATLANSHADEYEKMISFGQAIGPIFQITDDRIGIRGTAEEIGKPVGSDIKEGKNTLYWYLLKESASVDDRKLLLELEGHAPSPEDIAYVLGLSDKYEVDQKISLIEQQLEHEANTAINLLRISDGGKKILFELLTFVNKRKS